MSLNKVEKAQFKKEFANEDLVEIVEANEHFIIFKDAKGKLWMGKPSDNEPEAITYYCRKIKLKKKDD